jgi:cold shock protein
VQRTERGLQAVEVLDVQPPESDGDTESPHGPDLVLPDLLEPARVKWFDKVKGFGFANVFGGQKMCSCIWKPCAVPAWPNCNRARPLALRVIAGERGRMAVAIEPWEAALKKPAGSNGTDSDT